MPLTFALTDHSPAWRGAKDAGKHAGEAAARAGGEPLKHEMYHVRLGTNADSPRAGPAVDSDLLHFRETVL
jgi:hypothetical protein